MPVNLKRYMRLFREAFDDGLDFLIHDGRNGEWTTVIAKVGVAWALAQPGETFNLKSYEVARELGVTDSLMVWILMGVAVIHGMALIVNGSVRRTPTWRGICCFAGMLIFGFMFYVTWASSMVTVGIMPYLMLSLVFLELTGCRLAGDDRRCLMQQ